MANDNNKKRNKHNDNDKSNKNNDNNRSNDNIIVTLRIIMTTIIMTINVTIIIDNNDNNGNDACDEVAAPINPD